MAERFAHEKLNVYQKGMQFATLVDLATVDPCPANPSHVAEGRDLLRQIAAMLRQLSKTASDDG